jgi:hypothetical protein
MFDVATEVWNRVAMEENLKTDWAKERFLLDEPELDRRLEEEAAQLADSGEPPLVILAFQRLLPQLVENPALRSAVKRHPELATVFPEITSINFALKLAVKEYRLSPKATSRLRSLLNEAVLKMA